MGDQLKLTFANGGAITFECSNAVAAINGMIVHADNSAWLTDPAHPRVHWNLAHVTALEIIPEHSRPKRLAN
jgi:hypothetical protein